MTTDRVRHLHKSLSLGLVLAGGCAPSEVTATQLLVHVEAGADATTRLKYVRAFLYRTDAADESAWTEEMHFAPSAGATGAAMKFPFSFGIAQGRQERFMLVVKGYESSDPSAAAVIEQKIITGFQTEQKLQIRLALIDACLQRAAECSGLSQTCTFASSETSQCSTPPLVLGVTTLPPTDDARLDPEGEPERIMEAGVAEGGMETRRPDAVVEVTPAARLQALCDQGDLLSCTDLGIIYEDGDGVPVVDTVRAARLYQKACDGNYARGCANLGLAYYNAIGVAMDRVHAVTLFQKGCDLGSARACTNLGMQYASGIDGVPRDLTRAAELNVRACSLGEAVACSNAGNYYRNGEGVPRDSARAIQLETQACNGGEMGGCNDLGQHYALGLGVTQDMVRAAELFRQACAGGEQQGCNNLGRYGLR